MKVLVTFYMLQTTSKCCSPSNRNKVGEDLHLSNLLNMLYIYIYVKFGEMKTWCGSMVISLYLFEREVASSLKCWHDTSDLIHWLNGHISMWSCKYQYNHLNLYAPKRPCVGVCMNHWCVFKLFTSTINWLHKNKMTLVKMNTITR